MADASDFGEWLPLESAPRDGTRVLVLIRASEQGSAEVDVARWASQQECWIATDSNPDYPVTYSEAELVSWMPLPSPLPRLRSSKLATGGPARHEEQEIGGSGI